ncbi:small oligopeptide transporter [Mycena floridula]|nr:small oligopeptide transporter [Mycena floridula]
MTDLVHGEVGQQNPVYVFNNGTKSEKSLESQIAADIADLDFEPGREIFEVYDPNLDSDTGILEEDSPYPEVRSAVANFDDPKMASSTLRAWVLGLSFAALIPGLNQACRLLCRYPTVSLNTLVVLLIVFPIGRAWARFLPNVTIFGLQLNPPGGFTIKEHVLVTVMAGVGAQAAYATEIVAVQRVYYHRVHAFSFQWMLVMSTQLMGFSIGGLTRKFLVAPPSMIWPNTLVACSLFNTLHSQSYVGVGTHEGPSRERYFLIAFVSAILWYLVPGYLFQALRLVCWIAPNNVKLNQLFGYRSGLGFSILTFDWNQIAFIGWAEFNIGLGFVFFYWFVTPILYYKNVWFAQYMPISSSIAYDNTGKQFNVSRIINADGMFNITAFREYSPLYLSTTFAMSYGLSFLSITATVTHALIHFRKPIQLHFKRSLREQPDIHAQLMSKYPAVPEWYFGCIFVVTFILGCVCIELWHVNMPIWGLIVALVIALFYVIPIGMIQAVTNRQIGLNVVTELIIGFLRPGNPLAMMVYTYGYITMSQAMQFTADFKLGHYMKIPPRSMFWCQVVSTIVAGTVQLGVQSWMFATIPDICDANQKDNFTCNSIQVFGTASIIWGAIGPGLQFARNQIYYALVFFFIVGAACPILLWMVTRRYPHSILNYLKLIFSGVGSIPPATASNYLSWLIVGFIFQYLVRRKNFAYWAKYNYVLSGALDAGTGVGVLVVYFCLQYPLNGQIGANTIHQWWGNTVFKRTADWNQTPLRKLGVGEKFG